LKLKKAYIVTAVLFRASRMAVGLAAIVTTLAIAMPTQAQTNQSPDLLPFRTSITRNRIAVLGSCFQASQSERRNV
jgi:hypothetical protein